ncbi:DUF4126 domain-containing protein [Spirosoma utsteinense]|uniref:DUF4126 domain-containing protein n=1 Tax=Spirosoma utsteinense TaxID=2585773 RepID=A0ABR6W3X0_9BACT|nr:DUF4126 domain-containing protein [Spirosoma utsteinense]MBC3785188.1 hypothetical protein [Spirosoma utsteinense]MBC3790587.1 hypothetical protein [Spirosoma utsteinense]
MSIEWISSACIGLGLAACCGFRVFIPLLIASAATKLGIVGTMDGFEWLSGWPALAGLSVATAFELGAYYIPWLDNALDTLATPASIIAGTLLSTSFLQIDDPIIHWGLGLMLGGGSAGIVQAGTSLLRLGSTATTGGLGNPVVATGENIASLVLSVLTILLPLVAIIIVAVVVIFVINRLMAKRKVWFTKRV